ncbi:hypothetical protein ACWCPX_36100, partial [Streptomyces olivaceoviridis]
MTAANAAYVQKAAGSGPEPEQERRHRGAVGVPAQREHARHGQRTDQLAHLVHRLVDGEAPAASGRGRG